MSPEQLKQLNSLSKLFKEGQAGTEQIKQLSELLASINYQVDPIKEQVEEVIPGIDDGVR
ncbi:hypothetical protein [Thalassotalea sediminis]|uniref:hypothetical protein n=1 Tax=Thalassotalea sediminis TaxID=1759089 RepID=UPI002573FA2C|nr:hypothetical protein [Thalassotalea sediminis]